MFTSTTCEYPMMDCSPRPLVLERTKWKSSNELAPNCPRCASSNTKFCYYNNYSLSQPRYFCKGCRRYWTKGGSLRNVPLGGGCRKSRRMKAARQTECSSANYRPSPGSHECPSNGSVDIDLAAVFANYLNQNVENEESSSSADVTSNASSEIQANYLEIDNQSQEVLFDYQKPENLINGGDQFQEMIPQISMNEENIFQEFMDHNSNDFKLQTMVGDEIGLEILWTDGLNFPPLQDFEVFSSPDDQLRISENLENDYNWGSFDLSGYEIFSGP